MANRDNLSTSGSTSGVSTDWTDEEQYWRSNWSSRPYVSADQGFDYYRPGYQYGYESATRYRGRDWNDVEGDLRSGWERFENRGQRTWENVKDAVRDAWNRVTNR
jgi:hypothetical protein